MDRIFMKNSWATLPGKLILAQPLLLKESLRIRDGLGIPDICPAPKSAQTLVAVKTSILGSLWICRN